MAASLNEIYHLVGELKGTMKAVDEKVDGLKSDITANERSAAENRSAIHTRLNDLVVRTTHLESDVLSTKNKIEGMEKVTGEFTTLQTKAEGAGTVGRWLIRVGIGVVSFAGWLVGIYTYITGRPPP